MSKIRYVPHPGEYIKDEILELGMNQNEFAIRIGTTGKTLSKIINGEANLTFEIASKLADFFGTSVNMWMNLQTAYLEYLRNLEIEKQEKEELRIFSYFDKEYLKNILNMEITKDNRKEIILELKKLFMVSNLSCLNSKDLFAFCRTSVIKDIDEKQLVLRNAWISFAMYKSRNIHCEEYNEKTLYKYIPQIKELMSEKPEIFIPKLKEYLSLSGIKLVVLPYLKGSNISGVTRWLPNENAIMIAINDSGKDADKIWFNIFHELGHAIQNKKRHITISLEKDKINDEDEIQANNFARNTLINEKEYIDFINNKKFNINDIELFAKKQNIPLFIVIGRLQNDGYINWNEYTEFKPKYKMSFQIN